jgi:circadian clock protein KaiC
MTNALGRLELDVLMTTATVSADQRAGTGISGLDEILGGGLPRERVYLLEGTPGTGKTTLSLQFLLAGVQQKEPVLYIALSETAAELRAVAESHGWSLDGLDILELSVIEPEAAEGDPQYTLFHPAEVELNQTLETIRQRAVAVRPSRIVLDSLAEMRLLAQDPLIYRRQILAMKQYFLGCKCTVLFLDDRSPGMDEVHFQSLVHGVINLSQISPIYGAKRRRLEVVKLRGVRYRDGLHDYTIRTGGLAVFPRLVASEHHKEYPPESLSGGITGLDALLGGGLDYGTSTLVLGPAGAGKSTVATVYAAAAAEKGQTVAFYVFDEAIRTLLNRSVGLGIDIKRHIDSGRVRVRQVDPAELTPGEFAHDVRRAVEVDDVKVVVIDSLNGFMTAMPEERLLTVHLHELLTYLCQQGVVTILVMAQHGLLGTAMESPSDVSYLADTVVLLRYFESAGQVRKAISIVKKRGGGHESTIRELKVGPQGVQCGIPLTEFHGILTGVPNYQGAPTPLLGENGLASN